MNIYVFHCLNFHCEWILRSNETGKLIYFLKNPFQVMRGYRWREIQNNKNRL